MRKLQRQWLFNSRQTAVKKIAYYLFALTILVATSLSTGCTTSLRQWTQNCFKVGPNYCEPAAPVESQWIDYQKDPRLSSEIVDTSTWWTVFNDPKLNNLMVLASRQNLTLRSAGMRILQARAVRGIAAGNLFPQTQQAVGDFTRRQLSQNVANPFHTTNFDQWDAGFNLSWELDFWGRFRRGVESADAALDASIENYDDVLVILLSDVATSYVNIRTFQERLHLAQANVKSQENTQKVAQTRFDAKAISKLDLLQCRDNYSQSKALVQTLENGLRRENNALCILLGIPPHDLTHDPCVGEGSMPAAPADVAVGIPAELLRRRPDIRRAERLVAAQSARIGIAESELYPHFAINGVLQWQSENMVNFFDAKSTAGIIGPVFTWNILNYGRLSNAVHGEEAKFNELVYIYQDTVLKAAGETENAIIGFLTSQDQEANLRDAVAAVSEAEGLCLLEAQQGGKDYNRIYVIQLQKTLQEDQWATSKGDISINLINIYRALGGGWQIRLRSGTEDFGVAVADGPAPIQNAE